MSFDKKFHDLIEEGNSPDKEESWNKLKSQIEDESDETVIVSANKGSAALLMRRGALPIVAILLLFGIILALFLVSLKPPVDEENNLTRYCTVEEYTNHETDITLKDYSQDHDGRVLYFDWYDETEYQFNFVTELIESKEIICLEETMMDMNTGYIVTVRVTDIYTTIDFLETYDTMNDHEEEVVGVSVAWSGDAFFSRARFEYDGFRYYMEVRSPLQPNTVLDYVSLLIG